MPAWANQTRYRDDFGLAADDARIEPLTSNVGEARTQHHVTALLSVLFNRWS
jgi:hypothetical protein